MTNNSSVSVEVLKQLVSKDVSYPLAIYGRTAISVYDMLDGVQRDLVKADNLPQILKSSNDRVTVVEGYEKLEGDAKADFHKLIIETRWRKALIIAGLNFRFDSVPIANRIIHISQID